VGTKFCTLGPRSIKCRVGVPAVLHLASEPWCYLAQLLCDPSGTPSQGRRFPTVQFNRNNHQQKVLSKSSWNFFCWDIQRRDRQTYRTNTLSEITAIILILNHTSQHELKRDGN